VGQKNVVFAVLLAIFPGMIGLCGMGHIYAGHLKRGLVILFVGLVLVTYNHLAPAISYHFCFYNPPLNMAIRALDICFLVWQAFDAWRLCRQNNRLAREGR
jgi:hypothetical protein